MTEVYLALGSNVGDTRQYIATATELLADYLEDIKTAPLYTSRAVGYTEQADFTNTAISGYTGLNARELLAAIQRVEQQVGRVTRFRWGPREIDIDIVFFGQETLQTEDLTLPHPNFRDRDFVLRPLYDLNSEFKDPISGRTIAALLNALDPELRTIIE